MERNLANLFYIHFVLKLGLIWSIHIIGRSTVTIEVFCYPDQVADNATVFGVCLHVQEIVQRPPVGVATPPSLSSGRLCQFLVSAPRCYCLLTRVPFFDLHYEMLNRFVNRTSIGDFL